MKEESLNINLSALHVVLQCRESLKPMDSEAVLVKQKITVLKWSLKLATGFISFSSEAQADACAGTGPESEL